MRKAKQLGAEEMRLLQKGGDVSPWHKWGPYVSERSWGTVREDYSADGNAWDYFPHEHARFRAFRWGDDGIAGICDRYQVMGLSWAFWNGEDPFLKERLFGFGTFAANHGEDVKEYYYHLDNTPSHSYMKYLYKYPHKRYPYEGLESESTKRGIKDREYELLDTGIFDESRYFDIQIEYGKAGAEEMCVRVEVFNRGPDDATLDLVPQLWFRNNWAWKEERLNEPVMCEGEAGENHVTLVADDTDAPLLQKLNFEYKLGKRYLYAEGSPELLFTNNDTNEEKLFGTPNKTDYVKDGFHSYIVDGKKESVNPEKKGTKAGIRYASVVVKAGESKVFRMKLSDVEYHGHPLDNVDRMIERRKREADEFYSGIHPKNATDEEKAIQRQALSGMLWGKQIYLYDINVWLKGDNPNHPPPHERDDIRNTHWRHMISKRIMSMPDKWEYPWFAAWDLAFHCVSLALVDLDFAKEQLWLLLFDQFQHPNGQVPAYEWEFSELNPPVQAWAAYRLYKMELEKTGNKDLSFLKKCFHKLLLNFVWWVNKVDSKGNNVFEGGFLGLDNITVIDRSAEIPGGGKLEQSDGTGWMGLFCLTLMRMALELSKEDSDYEALATKFFEHYVYIGNALEHAETRDVQLWDDEDGFFYDVISFPDGTNERIKVRSLVGIIPIYAVDCITHEEIEQFKEFGQNFRWFVENRQNLTEHCVTQIGEGHERKYLLTLMNLDQMKRVLKRVWDKEEFRSDYGLRSLSKHYQANPYELLGKKIAYEPGEAESELKGGNSNWRGPVWFPTSFLFIEALTKLDQILGKSLDVDGAESLAHMAHHFATGLISLFKRDENGNRPIYSDSKIQQTDPNWKDLILFYEHFHGDTGRGLGASHQTGWTGLVANLIDEWSEDIK